MERTEICFKEYERALDLFVAQEQNLNRLALLRTGLLIIAVLFFGSYAAQFDEINKIREEQLEPIAKEERGWTVFGYLNAHQEVKNSIFVPDSHADAVVKLVARLRSFLGEDLTLENQSDKSMEEFVKLVRQTPAHIRIENSYLPNLTVPVSYSAMSVAVFAVTLTSFFYFAYRRQRLAALMRYIRSNLKELDKNDTAPPKQDGKLQPGIFFRGLLADAALTIASFREGIKGFSSHNSRKAKLLLASTVLGRQGASPYRLLNTILAVGLFTRLTFLAAHIVLAEQSITPTFGLEFTLVCALLVVPSLILLFVNRWYSVIEEDRDAVELLSDPGEF